MGRPRLLLICIGIVGGIFLATGTATQMALATCSVAEQIEGSCPPPIESELTPGGVDLSVDGGASSGGGSADGEGAGESDGGGPDPATPPALGSEETPDNDNGQPPECREAPDVCNPELVVRWSDIASFRAPPPRLAMEPAGWAVRGLPTNFVAEASVEVVSGSLLGFPAEVRFSPVGYAWDYGDGSTRYSTSGGASWGAAGVAEFAETNTSHVYTTRGDYAVTVAVELSAEYRFGGGAWRPIAGSIRIAAAASPVTVKSATTVLVADNCRVKPVGPGC